MKNPETLRKLTKEMRDTFATEEEFTPIAAASLPYLNAVIEEGLRIFPPVSFGLPRKCTGAVIDGHYVPDNVRFSKLFASDHFLTKSRQSSFQLPILSHIGRSTSATLTSLSWRVGFQKVTPTTTQHMLRTKKMLPNHSVVDLELALGSILPIWR